MTPSNSPVAWLPALSLLALLLAGSVWKASQPDPDSTVALLFPPWWSDAHILGAAAAEGRIVRIGLLHSLVVVRPDPAATGTKTGAWLRLNPIMAGCGDVA